MKKKCYGGYNKNPRQNITVKGIISLSSATNIVLKASHGVYNVNIFVGKKEYLELKLGLIVPQFLAKIVLKLEKNE